jgi:hypothetical protein
MFITLIVADSCGNGSLGAADLMSMLMEIFVGKMVISWPRKSGDVLWKALVIIRRPTLWVFWRMSAGRL